MRAKPAAAKGRYIKGIAVGVDDGTGRQDLPRGQSPTRSPRCHAKPKWMTTVRGRRVGQGMRVRRNGRASPSR